jgi:hypothetical protein
MRRFILPAVAALFGLTFLTASPASAQMTVPYGPPAYGPYYQPMLSPYLNMLRGGDPAANYFLGTLPEFQRRQNARIFQAEISSLDRVVQQPIAPEGEVIVRPLWATGHPATFGANAVYFPSPTLGMRTGTPARTGGLRGAGGAGGVGGVGGAGGMPGRSPVGMPGGPR